MRDARLIEDLRLLSAPDYGWLPWALAAMLLTAAAAWRWRRRTVPGSGSPSAADPQRRAWEEAMQALERLGTRLEPPRSRAYGIEVTDVLRRYVEGRYGLSAPRLTSLEFLEAARNGTVVAGPAAERLGRFLAACDWMKFGRAMAGADELRALHGEALAFVAAGRPQPQPAAVSARRPQPGAPPHGRAPC